ncbi:MAG: hypothetical protein Q9183_002019 [Haloplaca sp. 2 TL-2023]
MSFGVSVSDFVTLGQLSWKIYKRCKDSAGVYVELTGEVNSLRSVLQETEELLSAQDLTSRQKKRLLPVRQGCQSVLQDLDRLLANYESLATSTRRGYDRMGMALQDVTSIRQRLTSNVVLLDAFKLVRLSYILTLLHLSRWLAKPSTRSSQAKLQHRLDRLISEIRSGKRESSVLSAKSFDTAADSQETWDALRRDLEDIGISPQVIKDQRAFILDWFRNAIASGLAEETPPPVGEESNLFNESISKQDVDLGSGSQRNLVRGFSEVDLKKDSLGSSDPGPSSSAVPTSQAVRVERFPKPSLRISYLINRLIGTTLTLHHAVWAGDRRRIYEFLSGGVDINSRNSDGGTALHLAVYCPPRLENLTSIVEMLLEYGADVNLPNESKGKTPLHIAAWHCENTILLQLLQHGANINDTDRSGRTALYLAVSSRRKESNVTTLLNVGANLNIADHNGMTALHVATQNHQASIVLKLLGHGADINAKDPFGRTALHIATADSWSWIQLVLLDSGADIEARTRNGDTPLHLHSRARVRPWLFGDKECDGKIRSAGLRLLEAGVDVHAKNLKGETPLIIAVKRSKINLMKDLLEFGADVTASTRHGERCRCHR